MEDLQGAEQPRQVHDVQGQYRCSSVTTGPKVSLNTFFTPGPMTFWRCLFLSSPHAKKARPHSPMATHFGWRANSRIVSSAAALQLPALCWWNPIVNHSPPRRFSFPV